MNKPTPLNKLELNISDLIILKLSLESVYYAFEGEEWIKKRLELIIEKIKKELKTN